MSSKHPPITAGMVVRDGTEQPVGQVQEVSAETVHVHVHQDITVPLAAVAAVTDTQLVLPLHIDLIEPAAKVPSDETSTTPDPYTVEVPDPSIFLS